MRKTTIGRDQALPQPNGEGGENLDFPCSRTWRGHSPHKGHNPPSWLDMENQQRIDRLEVMVCRLHKKVEDLEKAND